MDKDCFRWELGGNLVFGAAQDEWTKTSTEELAAFLIIIFFDGGLVVPAKAFEGPKKARHEETEE